MIEGQINSPVPPTPHLRYINEAFHVLRQPYEDVSGEKVSWQGLYKKVRPFENSIELSDNVREVIVNFVSHQIPSLKDKIPSLSTFSDQSIVEALSHNWFETLGEAVVGRRNEILFSVMAHVVKRMESVIYKRILAELPEKDVNKLGLDFSTRDLLIELLDVGIKSDPLYIRFMAYSQLTPKPSEAASSVGMHLPYNDTVHTAASLFPRETQFISNGLKEIATKQALWQDKPGAKIFGEYLMALGELYSEKNVAKALQKQEEVEKLYVQTLHSAFPIVVTPATEGYYKEPYFDPELKISIVSPEAHDEKESQEKMKQAMSKSLDMLGVSQFEDAISNLHVKSVIVVGAFGVNLSFNAVAQEKPSIVMFINEHLRAYDRDFSDLVKKLIVNAKALFGDPIFSEKKDLLERMSRRDSILHEFDHSIYPEHFDQASNRIVIIDYGRFGIPVFLPNKLAGRPLTIIDEVKAEICHRALIPSLIDRGGIEGRKEEWAASLLVNSLRIAKEQPEGDPYWYAAVYCLNDLFEKGAVRMEDNQVYIANFDHYYELQLSAAKKVLAVYQDSRMTQQKASRWIKQHCVPNEQLKHALKTINF